MSRRALVVAKDLERSVRASAPELIFDLGEDLSYPANLVARIGAHIVM